MKKELGSKLETAKSLKATETILTGDGFHLNNEGGSIIAKALNTIANKGSPKNNRRRQENTRKTSTSRNHINPTCAQRSCQIHRRKREKKSERNRRQLQVTLTISLPKQWSGDQTATITGPEEGVNMAANEVINILEQYNENQDKYAKRKRETKDIPCKFYQEGKCKHGSKCDYAP